MAAPIKNAGKTRGRQFAPGNPGRPLGARNRRSVLVEQLMANDVESIVKAVIEKAVAGDMVAAKLVLDRVAPTPKGRALKLALNPVTDAESVLRAHTNLLANISNGVIAAEEGEAIGRVLAGCLKAIDSVSFEERLANLESLVAKPRPMETRQ
jgi:hypothetical protein